MDLGRVQHRGAAPEPDLVAVGMAQLAVGAGGGGLAQASIATTHGGCAAMNFSNCARDSLRRKITDPSAAAPCA